MVADINSGMRRKNRAIRTRSRGGESVGLTSWLLWVATATVGMWLGMFGVSYAQQEAVLSDIEIKPVSGGATQVRLIFDQALKSEPDFLGIDSPAQLSIDLTGVRNGMKSRTSEVNSRLVRGYDIAESSGRTRINLRLSSLVPYGWRVSTNTLIVTLGHSADATVVKPSPVSEQDTSGAVTTDSAQSDTMSPAIRPDGHSVEDVDFRRGHRGQGQLIIEMTSAGVPAEAERLGNRLRVTLPDVQLPQRLQRRLEVLDFATVVETVDTRQKGSNVELMIRATDNFTHLLYMVGNTIVVELSSPDEVSEDQEPVFTGDRITLNFQQIGTRAVLALIAEVAQANIVVSDSVQGTIAIRLEDVPWDQALAIVMHLADLDKRDLGKDVLLVAPREELARRDEALLQAYRARQELAPLVSRTFVLNYASAEEFANLLRSKDSNMLSDRGRTSFDSRTNTLLIQDIPAKLDEIAELLVLLDKPVRQVLIEARVVSANNSFQRELGARFGVSSFGENGHDGIVATSGRFEATDLMAGSAVESVMGSLPYGRVSEVALPFAGGNGGDSGGGSGGGNSDSDGGEGRGDATGGGYDRLNVNLPAQIIGGAIPTSIGIAILGADYLVDLELSAMQREGYGETVSAPRIVTSSDSKAVIKQGSEVPYQANSGGGDGATTTEFKEAVLMLEVTPHITPENQIILDLNVTNDSIGEIVPTGEGGAEPTINVQQVQTVALVDNGQTVVLGGIFQQDRAEGSFRVPILGDIPVIGRLFRSESRVDDRSELIIFVTPRIITPELLIATE